MKPHSTIKYVLIALLAIPFLFSSCDKDGKVPSTSKFIDVNIRFTARIKPTAGQELITNLYYQDVTGQTIIDIEPDLQIITVLTEEEIDGGLFISFEEVSVRAEEIYACAYVDINENGIIDRGDLAMFYKDLPFVDVEEEGITPTNIANEYAINLNLNKVTGETTEVKDIEGNVYKTVVIGEQEWFAENLRATKFKNGDTIATGFSNEAYTQLMNREENSGTPAYSIHPDADFETDGLLYNWFAVADVRGICPEGWRVPSDTDWFILERFLGIPSSELALVAWRGAETFPAPGTVLKSSDREFDGTNDYGFNALPSGKRNKDTGVLEGYNVDANFWCTAENPDLQLQGIRRIMRNAYRTIYRGVISKVEGESVRCVRIDY